MNRFIGMYKNPYYLALLIVMILASLIYTTIAFVRYTTFTSLDTHSKEFEVFNWKIKEKSSDKFYIEAFYQFNVDNKQYQGSTTFEDTPYRNAYAAEMAIKSKQTPTNDLWYEKNNPLNSSLQKEFPIKEWVSSVFLWGLTLYILWLGFYILKQSR